MKIGIPTFGCDAGKSGISRYVVELIKAMVDQRGDDIIEVLGLPAENGIFTSPEQGIETINPPLIVEKPPLSILWHLTMMPHIVKQRGYDVLFCPAGNRRLPWHSPCPVVGTVHDMSWLHMDAKYDRFRTIYLTKLLPALVGRLDKALTVSESSKRDILANTKLTDPDVVVTPIAMDHEVYNENTAVDPEVMKRLHISGEYIFYVSRLEHPGKNHAALIRAFEKLCTTGVFAGNLVLAGGDFLGAEAVHKLVEKSPVRDRIQMLGFVRDDCLPSLFAGATVFVFPSFYEGFGIPVLEAMACGAPVIASDCSSLPEVGGDAVSYFDPNRVDQLCDRLVELLSDPALRQARRAAGIARARTFSWQRTAEQTWGVLRALAEERK
jgi:glycosyltransferase involved in cell wall biosynthesis